MFLTADRTLFIIFFGSVFCLCVGIWVLYKTGDYRLITRDGGIHMATLFLIPGVAMLSTSLPDVLRLVFG